MELHDLIFQVWIVMKFKFRSWKVMESCVYHTKTRKAAYIVGIN